MTQGVQKIVGKFSAKIGSPYWTPRRWKKVDKSQFFNFSGHIYRLRGVKILSKSPILMFFESWEGFWNMPSCFQMFVDVFKTFRGVKNDPVQKMSFFSTNPLLKTAISWFDFCRYKPLTFWWFQCIFLTNWLSRMGKPLVPVGPTHFSHLGHPNISNWN